MWLVSCIIITIWHKCITRLFWYFIVITIVIAMTVIISRVVYIYMRNCRYYDCQHRIHWSMYCLHLFRLLHNNSINHQRYVFLYLLIWYDYYNVRVKIFNNKYYCLSTDVGCRYEKFVLNSFYCVRKNYWLFQKKLFIRSKCVPRGQ